MNNIKLLDIYNLCWLVKLVVMVTADEVLNTASERPLSITLDRTLRLYPTSSVIPSLYQLTT